MAAPALAVEKVEPKKLAKAPPKAKSKLAVRGKTKVKVPGGTQSGRRFRIASKGMPVLRSRQSGDMYVQVLVETPQKLTKRQKELLAEFEQQSSTETQPEAAGFFSKVKDFLDGFGNRQGPP